MSGADFRSAALQAGLRSVTLADRDTHRGGDESGQARVGLLVARLLTRLETGLLLVVAEVALRTRPTILVLVVLAVLLVVPVLVGTVRARPTVLAARPC